MNLENNSISVLKNKMFYNLNQTNSIKLSFNKIELIESDAFNGLLSLEISSQSLTCIKSQQVNGLFGLKELILMQNNINQIETNSFIGLRWWKIRVSHSK